MEGGNPNDVIIKINKILAGAKPLLLPSPNAGCIHKVPHEIRKLNEDAYTPKVVSIGPFHRGNEKLLKMEEHKIMFCRGFIERSEKMNLESFVSCVQELEPQVRASYSDEIKLSEEELVMVIFVDSCFILEFLLQIFFAAKFHGPVFLPRRLVNSIYYDLFLLENQVPFFVLEKLYNLAFPSTLSSSGNPTYPSMLLLSLCILPETIISVDKLLELCKSGITGVFHFTDLYRKLILRSSQFFQPSASECSREGKVPHLYSATELNELGVKFKVNEKSKCILDLELSSFRTLRIPSIKVDDNTEVVLRNLLAFEQCHCVDEAYLTDYIIFFDFLINTDKDVDLMIKEGIIENWLGDSNAVAQMFNSLGVNIMYPDFNEKYSRIFERLNTFCARPCVQKFATLKRDYCNTAWQAAATFAAIFLLILTVIQTVFAVLQGVH
ncbi:hypothetical protein PIB30_049039 [Stylosanthes scabra]|uniref:Uncharacterized protein n=1 Tax=Stylosanthes scabra TaxID=79078 RepID=A0ABU6THM0_9FABA|nr:hypothetical protein [Stylosanthes scabra]